VPKFSAVLHYELQRKSKPDRPMAVRLLSFQLPVIAPRRPRRTLRRAEVRSVSPPYEPSKKDLLEEERAPSRRDFSTAIGLTTAMATDARIMGTERPITAMATGGPIMDMVMAVAGVIERPSHAHQSLFAGSIKAGGDLGQVHIPPPASARWLRETRLSSDSAGRVSSMGLTS
jgi:hypothetical protein